MKLFLGRFSTTTNRGYCGMLDLLSSKVVIDYVFGNKPHILTDQPNSLNSSNNKEATKKYLDICKLEISPDVFHENYIGNMSMYTSISVQDV